MKSRTTLLLTIIGLSLMVFLAFYISIQLQNRRVSDNGIEGRVFLGPQCAVVGETQTCPDNPYETRVHAFYLDAGKRDLVQTVETDADGNFSINLKPGSYLIRPAGGNPFPACYEKVVEVRDNEFTKVVLNCDTGIR